jgi:hypothetical protein
MFILLSLLVAIIGLLLYALCGPNGKIGWIGQTMFWCGLLVTLLRVQNTMFSLGGLGIGR